MHSPKILCKHFSEKISFPLLSPGECVTINVEKFLRPNQIGDGQVSYIYSACLRSTKRRITIHEKKNLFSLAGSYPDAESQRLQSAAAELPGRQQARPHARADADAHLCAQRTHHGADACSDAGADPAADTVSHADSGPHADPGPHARAHAYSGSHAHGASARDQQAAHRRVPLHR